MRGLAHAGRFVHLQLDGRHPLDPDRLDLFSRWFDVAVDQPEVACDGRWTALGVAIVTNEPLTPWAPWDEYAPDPLPDGVPITFLTAFDDLVEQEEEMTLQHLNWDEEDEPR